MNPRNAFFAARARGIREVPANSFIAPGACTSVPPPPPDPPTSWAAAKDFRSLPPPPPPRPAEAPWARHAQLRSPSPSESDGENENEKPVLLQKRSGLPEEEESDEEDFLKAEAAIQNRVAERINELKSTEFVQNKLLTLSPNSRTRAEAQLDSYVMVIPTLDKDDLCKVSIQTIFLPATPPEGSKLSCRPGRTAIDADENRKEEVKVAPLPDCAEVSPGELFFLLTASDSKTADEAVGILKAPSLFPNLSQREVPGTPPRSPRAETTTPPRTPVDAIAQNSSMPPSPNAALGVRRLEYTPSPLFEPPKNQKLPMLVIAAEPRKKPIVTLSTSEGVVLPRAKARTQRSSTTDEKRTSSLPAPAPQILEETLPVVVPKSSHSSASSVAETRDKLNERESNFLLANVIKFKDNLDSMETFSWTYLLDLEKKAREKATRVERIRIAQRLSQEREEQEKEAEENVVKVGALGKNIIADIYYKQKSYLQNVSSKQAMQKYAE